MTEVLSPEGIAALAHEYQSLSDVVDALEDQLKQAKESLRVVGEELLPAAMDNAGVTKIVLDNGITVQVVDEVYASIPALHADAAFRWLDGHGFGGIIKTDVVMKFGRDQRELAQQLAQQLAKQLGQVPIIKESVHPSTLKSFLKEQLAHGTDIPLEVFGARPIRRAKVTT